MKKLLLLFLTITLLNINLKAQCTVAVTNIVEDFNTPPACWIYQQGATTTGGVLRMWYGSNFPILAVTPKVDNANGILTFVAKRNQFFPVPSYTIGVLTNPNSVSTFVAIASFSVPNTSFQTFTFDLSAYSGTGQYIGILSPSSVQSRRGVIDNLNYQSACQSTTVNAIAQDITVQLNNNGSISVDPSLLDNGSTSDCGDHTFSLDVSNYNCSDIGVNSVVFTAIDNQGNTSTATANITIINSIDDETILATANSVCSGSATTITTNNSISGIDYFLRNNANDTIIDGPIVGTGNALSFNTGNLNTAITYNVYAETSISIPGALEFDGVSGYTSIGTDNRNITTKISMETWVKTTSTVAKLYISKYTGGMGVYMMMDANGKVSIIGRDGVGPKNSGISATAINDNQWHHIVGTVNVTTGDWKIYVDGVDETPNPNQGAGITLASTSPFYIGANSITAAVFDGIIDKAVIWNIELSAATIASNINGCFSEYTPGVVGYFDFDEGAGTTIIDKSGNGNGSLVSMNPSTDWVAGVNNCPTSICDLQMTQTATVTISPSYNLSETISVCSGENYTFPDGFTANNITSSISHTSNMITSISCDSIISTTVNVNPTYNATEYVFICSGENYTFLDGSTQNNITSQVIHTNTFQTNIFNCDSTIVTTVNIHPVYNQNETVSVCYGENYTFPDGSTQNNIIAQVVHISNLQTINNCDSIITTTVNVNPIYNQTEAVSICNNDSYTFPDGTTQHHIISQTTHISNLQTTNGCDSIITTTLNVKPEYNLYVTVSICSDDSYTFPDGTTQHNITSQVVYSSSLQTVVFGCDSIINTTVTVNPIYNQTENTTICYDESYTFPDGTTTHHIIHQITHTSNLQTQNTACDSVIITTVNIIPQYNFSETVTICNNSAYTFPDGSIQNNITAQVVYISTLQTTNLGCDSIITTTVNVEQLYNQTENVAVCYNSSYTFPDGSTQNNITAQVVYTSNLQTVNTGCDSVVVTTVNITTINKTTTVSGNEISSNQADANYKWLNCNTNEYISGENFQQFTVNSNGDYAVEITYNNCIDTSDCVSITNTAIHSIDYSKISIYPNPVFSQLSIINNELSILKIDIIDVMGKTIKTVTENTNSIDVSELNKGTYFIKIQTKKGQINKRFVKM